MNQFLNFQLRVFVIIPAYNESTTIGQVVREVKQYADQAIVVDDCSCDGTQELAQEAGALVLTHLINRGQGAALKTGIDYALSQGADIIVTFDSDGQHLASEIPKVVAPVAQGEAEVVLGSRFLSHRTHLPFSKFLTLKAALWLTKIITGLKITDTHNGFRAFSLKAAKAIKISQNRMTHASEIIHEIARQKISFKEVPVTVQYTAYSLIKGQRIREGIKILRNLVLKRLVNRFKECRL